MLDFSFECIAVCSNLPLVLFPSRFKSTNPLFMRAFFSIHISDIPSFNLQKTLETQFHPSKKKIVLSKAVINNKYHTDLKMVKKELKLYKICQT